jgi:hypothetical protein
MRYSMATLSARIRHAAQGNKSGGVGLTVHTLVGASELKGAGWRGTVMTKVLRGVLLLLAACGVSAQESSVTPSGTNAAAASTGTSAASVRFDLNTDADASTDVAIAGEGSSGASESALPAAPAAQPAATPKYIFGERDDYRWQLGVGFDYFRFQSSAFNANLFGVNTSVSYYTNSWFGLEGDIVTGFSTSTYFNNGDHAKIFGGMGGFRLGSRRAKWEPWVHGLVGGAHLQPQTAEGGRSALMAEAGGGVDYRVHARLSFRAEADWVHTGYFNQSQNNVQAIGGVVLHF